MPRLRGVQTRPASRHEREDIALAQYHNACRLRDRAVLQLRVTLPRGAFVAGIAALGPSFVTNGSSAGALGIGVGEVLMLTLAFRHLGVGLEQVLAARAAWEQIQPFWRAAAQPDAVPQARSSETPDRRSSGQAIVEARNLVFRYSQQHEPVLRGVSLSIHERDRILLQGASGSGKSTLATILAGQVRSAAGLCLFNGLNLASWGESAWRRRVALVPQFHESHILIGSLAFNLLVGRNWPPRAEDLADAERLCRALGLGPLLERMPGGLFQQVGETGWQLSHGERERIYIARALLQGPEVMILDESVSALDPETFQQTMRLLWNEAPALVLIVHP